MAGSSRFEAAFRTGLRDGCRHFTIYVKPNGQSCLQLGQAIGRRVGNAVVRNHLRRVMRELLRHNWPGEISGADIVIVPRASFDEISTHERIEIWQRTIERIRKAWSRMVTRDEEMADRLD